MHLLYHIHTTSKHIFWNVFYIYIHVPIDFKAPHFPKHHFSSIHWKQPHRRGRRHHHRILDVLYRKSRWLYLYKPIPIHTTSMDNIPHQYMCTVQSKSMYTMLTAYLYDVYIVSLFNKRYSRYILHIEWREKAAAVAVVIVVAVV